MRACHFWKILVDACWPSNVDIGICNVESRVYVTEDCLVGFDYPFQVHIYEEIV